MFAPTAHSGLFGGNGNGQGVNYFGHFEDFMSSSNFPTTTPSKATTGPWTRTLVNSSVCVNQAAGLGFGGVLKATNDTAQNDAQQYQWEQEVCMCYGPGTAQYPQVGGLDMHFEIRMAIGDITNMDFGLGFAKTGTTQIATPASDLIGMRKVNKTTFSLDVQKASSAYSGADATSFLTVPDTQFHTYYICVRPYDDLTTGSVHVSMDGKIVAEWTRRKGNPVTLPQVSLAPWFGQLSHAASMTGASLIVQYEYVAFSQRRYK